jgi:hypothetical protein
LQNECCDIRFSDIEKDVPSQHVRKIMGNDLSEDDIGEFVRLSVAKYGVQYQAPSFAVDGVRVNDVVMY